MRIDLLRVQGSGDSKVSAGSLPQKLQGMYTYYTEKRVESF